MPSVFMASFFVPLQLFCFGLLSFFLGSIPLEVCVYSNNKKVMKNENIRFFSIITYLDFSLQFNRFMKGTG